MLALSNRFVFEGNEIAWGTLGEGAPLVLLHGTPFSSQVWRRIAPWLARNRRVFFYDLLGYGQSAKPDADVSLGMQNRLMVAMLRAWRLDRPEVVAHDFGGTTALRAHFLDGIEYAALTLIDPVAIAPQGSPFGSMWASTRLLSPGCPPMRTGRLVRHTSRTLQPGR